MTNQTSPKSRYVGRRIQSRCLGNGGFCNWLRSHTRHCRAKSARLSRTQLYQGLPVASAHDCPAGSGRNLTGQNLQPERSAVLDQLSLPGNKLDRLSRAIASSKLHEAIIVTMHVPITMRRWLVLLIRSSGKHVTYYFRQPVEHRFQNCRV